MLCLQSVFKRFRKKPLDLCLATYKYTGREVKQMWQNARRRWTQVLTTPHLPQTHTGLVSRIDKDKDQYHKEANTKR